MGIKKLKEKYRIEHIVHRNEKGICIGSGYMPEIIVLSDDGKFITKYKNGNYNDGWNTNEDLKRYQEEMLSDEDSGELKRIIEEPDVYENKLPVFTIHRGKLIETFCEEYGWPNVTYEGELMYENTFFNTREEAVKNGIEDCKSWMESLAERKRELEAEAQQKQVKFDYYKECLSELSKK